MTTTTPVDSDLQQQDDHADGNPAAYRAWSEGAEDGPVATSETRPPMSLQAASPPVARQRAAAATTACCR